MFQFGGKFEEGFWQEHFSSRRYKSQIDGLFDETFWHLSIRWYLRRRV